MRATASVARLALPFLRPLVEEWGCLLRVAIVRGRDYEPPSIRYPTPIETRSIRKGNFAGENTLTRVYIDMVADAFDSAHLELLRRARALGDELVVGVPSDDDCEWFHRRPARRLAERSRVVAQCGYADRVVSGAPVFLTREWLCEEKIDLVAHSSTLSEQALRYWYSTPIELGMFRTLSVSCGSETTDLEGRLRVPSMLATPDTVGLRVCRRIGRRLPSAERMIRQSVLISGLRRLADAMCETPLDGRYWIVGGLLLGWAREGKPLASDLKDADFAYLDEDHERFLASVPALVKAGFKPLHRFSSADGRYVEHRFSHRGAWFEFFRLTRRGDRWQYSLSVSGDELVELVAEVPCQPRVEFRFLGRSWRKVLDHELALNWIYGDWRSDRPDWSFASDRAVVKRIPMAILPCSWNWPSAIERGPGEHPVETMQCEQ